MERLESATDVDLQQIECLVPDVLGKGQEDEKPFPDRDKLFSSIGRPW